MNKIKIFGDFIESLLKESIYQNGSDPYEYKVEADHWLASLKGKDTWFEITGKDFKPEFQVSIDFLDNKFPDARSKNAPKRFGSKQTLTTKTEVKTNLLSTKPTSNTSSYLPQLSYGNEPPARTLFPKQNYGNGKNFGASEQADYFKYKNDPSVYWSVWDADKTKSVAESSNSTKLVYAASVSKVVTAACALDNLGGNLSNQTDWSDLKKFLVKSDNGVWNKFTKLAGGAKRVNDWAKKWSGIEPGRISGGNKINATGMCRFWCDVLNNRFTGAKTIQEITAGCATSNSRSRAYTPKNCAIGGKTGLYQQNMHDSAWIITPSGRRFCITVLTEKSSTYIVAVMFGGLLREYCGAK